MGRSLPSAAISGKTRMQLSARLLRAAFLWLAISATPVAFAQFVAIAPGAPVQENFDTLAASGTGTALPAGWQLHEAGSNANTSYAASDGANNAGNTYSFGANGSSERALGAIASNSLQSRFGVRLQNTSGDTIDTLAVSFTGEQWRVGGSGNTDHLRVAWSLDASSLDTGSWTEAPELDFHSLHTSGSARKLDGNAATNQLAVSGTLSGLALAPGASLWLRWQDENINGADDGLAIDDVNFLADGGPGPGGAPQVVSIVPADGAVNVPPATDIRIGFDQSVTVSNAFALDCNGTPIAFLVTGAGASRTITPDVLLPAEGSCRFDIFADGVRNGDDEAMPADVVVRFLVAGDTTGDYYAQVNASSPAQLRCTLHETIKGHTIYPYSGGGTNTWTILEIAQQDPADPARMIDVYRNRSYRIGSDRAGSGGGLTYNREHTWPNSLGFPSSGLAAYTDTHMLWLSDTDHNAKRGNKPYGNCTSGCSELVTEANQGVGGAGQSNRYKTPDGSNGTFEVWDHRKGDMARAIFYMAIRYEGIAAEDAHDGNIPDLELTDNRNLIVNTSNTAAKAYMGLLGDLLAWHLADPPDTEERARNDLIQFFQGNRNPFVDHPEWATRALFESTWPATCELGTGSEVIFADDFEG